LTVKSDISVIQYLPFNLFATADLLANALPRWAISNCQTSRIWCDKNP